MSANDVVGTLTRGLKEFHLDDDTTIVDDHHSPVEPSAYIEMRLVKMIEAYQRKIPWFYNWRRFWELVLAVCMVAGATMSFLPPLSPFVAIATSLAAATTSWNSHDDLSKRIVRYTTAVRSLERLMWWWKSLDDIERSNVEFISRLIEDGEAIISNERLAWLTAARKEEADRQGVDAKDGEKETAAFSGEERGPVGLTKGAARGAARGAGAARARQRV